MEHHVGIDVSLELSSLCVLDATGKVIREAKVASEPEALVKFLRGLDLTIVRVGLEAGPLSQWLYDGLHEAGFEAVLAGSGHCSDRHVKAALSAMAVKTDRRGARGIARLLRVGGDPGGGARSGAACRFRSTPPHGGRPAICGDGVVGPHVSIHAPAQGATPAAGSMG